MNCLVFRTNVSKLLTWTFAVLCTYTRAVSGRVPLQTGSEVVKFHTLHNEAGLLVKIK